MSRKKEEDFTEKFEKLLDKKPKSGTLKEWNKEWDTLMKQFIGDEESETKKSGKTRGKKKTN